jgi:hypothetical protein
VSNQNNQDRDSEWTQNMVPAETDDHGRKRRRRSKKSPANSCGTWSLHFQSIREDDTLQLRLHGHSVGYQLQPSFSHRFPPCRMLQCHTSPPSHYTRHVSASVFLSPRSIIPSSYLEMSSHNCSSSISSRVQELLSCWPASSTTMQSEAAVGRSCMGGGRRCRKSLVETLPDCFSKACKENQSSPSSRTRQQRDGFRAHAFH